MKLVFEAGTANADEVLAKVRDHLDTYGVEIRPVTESELDG